MKLTDQIVQCLQEHGPKTRAELEFLLEIPQDSIGNTLSKLRKNTPRHGKRIHIKAWTHHADGVRDYLRPVYAAGEKRCAKRPPPKPLIQIRRDYVARSVSAVAARSPFHRVPVKQALKLAVKMRAMGVPV